jgi:hypothetical protein
MRKNAEVVARPKRALWLFIKWFTDCWQEAGGASCALPAHLRHHDGGTPYDLKRGGKVSPEPVFPDA